MAVPEVTPGLPTSGEALDGSSPGERCDVGVLCAAIAEAAALGADRPDDEVTAIRTAFFDTAGAVTEAHGGYADRDDLCAVLCVFGTPASATRGADAALAAARDLRERLAAELPDVEFGIGVSAETAVAGWIQAMGRFEPLTIAGPVAEAKRLCELAARGAAPVVASERALDCASPEEAGRWARAEPEGVAPI